MFRRGEGIVGPARRLPRPVLIAAAAALVLLVGGGAAWLLSGSSRERTARTSVELALPKMVDASLDPASGGDPALIERGAGGPLPMVARDGRQAWQVYARPFDRSDKRPRIAIVIANLGQAGAETEAAIKTLPGAVTLGFNPYARNLPGWIAKARAAGHELIVGVPMEPLDYPREDPGPETLLLALTPKQNLDRLEWALSRGSGYVGVTNFMGSRFTAAPDALGPIFEVLKGRGLLFLETRASNQSAVAPIADKLALPYAANDRDLDGDHSRAGIEQALADLETIARKKGAAIGTGEGNLVTIDRVASWAATLDGKGLALAPLSALVATHGAAAEASAH